MDIRSRVAEEIRLQEGWPDSQLLPRHYEAADRILSLLNDIVDERISEKLGYKRYLAE